MTRKYQTPNWSLRKVKKMNFAHNLLITLINLLQFLKFYEQVANIELQRFFPSKHEEIEKFGNRDE